MVGGGRWHPKRGDAVWLELSPQAGHEQSGIRPALVLSPDAYNKKTGLFIVCPITNQAKGYPFEVRLPDDGLVTGVVGSDQIKSLDWRARKAKFKCKLSRDVVEETLAKCSTLLTL